MFFLLRGVGLARSLLAVACFLGPPLPDCLLCLVVLCPLLGSSPRGFPYLVLCPSYAWCLVRGRVLDVRLARPPGPLGRSLGWVAASSGLVCLFLAHPGLPLPGVSFYGGRPWGCWLASTLFLRWLLWPPGRRLPVLRSSWAF